MIVISGRAGFIVRKLTQAKTNVREIFQSGSVSYQFKLSSL
jgi:hypothetical protein